MKLISALGNGWFWFLMAATWLVTEYLARSH